MVLSATAVMNGPSALAGASGGHLLKDLPVFSSTRYDQWAGAGSPLSLETVQHNGNPALPVDSTETYNGLPSMHVNVTSDGSSGYGWWSVTQANNNWETYTLAPYYANGAFEFNVKGAVGGEAFTVGLGDRDYRRDPVQYNTPSLQSGDYVTVTTDWQHVRIPLTDLIPQGSIFDLNQAYLLYFGSANNNAQEFWLNDIKFTSPDPEHSAPFIKVNQLGYSILANKYALVSGYADELNAVDGTPFKVKRASTNAVVYTGKLKLVKDHDPQSGERIFEANFSPLILPGTYYLSVTAPGVADSLPFQIGSNLYRPLVVDATRYFYYQRQGIGLDAAHAGAYTRGVGHPQDANAPFASGAPARDVSQGWYDAGDYGKYVNAGAVAVSRLAWTYQLFPGEFKDRHLNIPESGNGVPDILDEMKWELDFILKMQDRTSGGFYHMVQPTGNAAPDMDTTQRIIEDVNGSRTNVRPTDDTASAAAALAETSISFKKFNPTYANTLLAAARRGWDYLVANPDGVASVPGPYGIDDDRAARLWAAAALYRATGDKQYNQYFLDNYRNFASVWDGSRDNPEGVGNMAQSAFLDYLKAARPDATAWAWFATKFKAWREPVLARAEQGPWRNTLQDNDYYWGSNGVALSTMRVLAIGSVVLGQHNLISDIRVIRAVGSAMNYILGINPLRLSYVSGHGADSITTIFSTAWSNAGHPGIPKGYLPGGPNIYNNALLSCTAPAKCYLANDSNWTTNENAIYWNADLVMVATLAAQLP
ncbi:glycoside hydrolase family 9 protein [Rhizomonospora bruguierae]|uniref:glycoside hydrolase family 9 protein n=1 Tax=Rhizomonospora bruguierae TaxID=1581705 RepID=UPI001BCB9B96|nr:glycoside hydrolase family 9 protein [Micromonospora sp. NBRC 107566]